jgi:hypothetical protein
MIVKLSTGIFVEITKQKIIITKYNEYTEKIDGIEITYKELDELNKILNDNK